jgi:hypothetical protein
MRSSSYWLVLSAANIPIALLAGRVVFGSVGAFLAASISGVGLGARVFTLEQAEAESDTITENFKASLIVLVLIPVVLAEDWLIRTMGWR